jgi:MGT family glycosyltransferase
VARFLFVVPPLVGHTNPTVSVALELTARGHEVAWVGHPKTVRPLLPPGATLFALDDDLPVETWAEASSQARAVRGLEALKFLWEGFLAPLARAMVPGVEDAARAFAPDVLAVDQQAVAGALVARRRGLRWASLATTSAGLTDPLAALPKVQEWLAALLAALEREAGLPAADHPDLSPTLVIAFTTEALVGPRERFPAHYRFVGPALRLRPEPTPFPWEALRPGLRVLVSLGTVNAEAGARFYPIVVEALGAGAPPPQGILVAPDGLLPSVPANVLVRSYVPQLALLPHVHAVVCHAGHNTVCEALAQGLPLVVLPIKDDQPVVAEQVVAAGAGIRLKFGRVRAEELREAVGRVLHEPSFRDAAARVRRSFAEAGGAPRAAELLEALA